MPLPASLQYGQVMWTAVLAGADGSDADGLPDASTPTGEVEFRPSTSPLLATAGPTPVTVFATPVTYQLDSSGTLRDSEGRDTISLVATNSAGVTPVGWTWTCTYRLDGGITRGSFSFSLPANTTVDLTTVAPVAESNGVPIIQGPPGIPGGVTVVGTAASPISDPGTTRPVGAIVVYWMCVTGLVPNNALNGDFIWNA